MKVWAYDLGDGRSRAFHFKDHKDCYILEMLDGSFHVMGADHMPRETVLELLPRGTNSPIITVEKFLNHVGIEVPCIGYCERGYDPDLQMDEGL